MPCVTCSIKHGGCGRKVTWPACFRASQTNESVTKKEIIVVLGTTGTRNGGGFARCQKFYQFLDGVTEFHHGDCVGWDLECFTVCQHLGITTVSHPPDNDAFRAFAKSTFIHPPMPYLERNKNIVNAVDFIIAAPDGPEKVRSGTWSTVRYAKKVGTKGVVWM